VTIWLAIGFAGQLAFFLRFFVQWVASERRQQSHIPVAFWYLSIVGAALVLAYAIKKRDPVFIAGQSFGFLVYLRNLVLIQRGKPDGKPRS
jgi:lipid-A-disaccharide synthase-like uncharacterized protein